MGKPNFSEDFKRDAVHQITVLGTFVVWWLQQEISSINASAWPIAIGSFFIALVLFFPRGPVALRARDDGLGQIPVFVYERFPILHDRRGQLAGTLSGGQKQQLAISRALCGDPAVYQNVTGLVINSRSIAERTS